MKTTLDIFHAQSSPSRILFLEIKHVLMVLFRSFSMKISSDKTKKAMPSPGEIADSPDTHPVFIDPNFSKTKN